MPIPRPTIHPDPDTKNQLKNAVKGKGAAVSMASLAAAMEDLNWKDKRLQQQIVLRVERMARMVQRYEEFANK